MGDESHESDEEGQGHATHEGRQVHRQGRDRRAASLGHGAEEGGLRQDPGGTGGHRGGTGQEAGQVQIPGVCMVKTRYKKPTKAGKREMFGKVVKVKAKPGKTVVKAFPVAAIKAVV